MRDGGATGPIYTQGFMTIGGGHIIDAVPSVHLMKLSQTGNNFRLGLAMDRAHDVSIISMLDEEKNRLPSSFNNIALLVVREF